MILILIVVELVQLYWINALINKCMSKNFYDYQSTKGLDKKDKQGKMLTVEAEADEPENLDYLNFT